MRALVVGVNLQPDAVREFYGLGITRPDLDRVGLPAFGADRLEEGRLKAVLHLCI